jgi:arabinose-5-phosphate isomerase
MSFLEVYSNVLKSEADSLVRASTLTSEDNLKKVVDIFSGLKSSGGKLILCGVGKSGIIGQKIASTFSSLGLPSIFLHPTEALHGDLGRVSSLDAIIFLSKSGTTEEIIKLIPFLSISSKNMIGLLGNVDSPIAEKCKITIDCSVEKEACINNQAPTNSSTVALAVGDALAVIYEKVVGLSKEGFAVNHPGGFLGKSLALKVSDVMISREDCPFVSSETTLQDIILEMTSKNYGLCFVEDNNEFKGIIVEGDIRRAFAKSSKALDFKASEMMNTKPTAASINDLAFDALKLMESGNRKLNVLPVIDNNKVQGLIRLHDLLKEGFPSQG